jgi:hypothetical protein
VADQRNNRVLFFPAGFATATKVYGQGGSLTTCSSNKGGISASSLSGPHGLTLDSSNNLFVADQDNSRVLFFPVGSTVATKVYGQASFATNLPNGGGLRSAISLWNPMGLAVDGNGRLYIADESNNRMLGFT